MLATLTVSNYRCFEYCEVQFDPITIFVGPNDRGKSTLAYNALEVILTNSDWPVEDLRDGTKEGFIEVTFRDGRSIRRERTLSTQRSVLRDREGNEESFPGKKDIKDLVENLTGIRKIIVDEAKGPENMNFLKGRHSSFMLGARSSTVQKRMIALTGANRFERAKKSISSSLQTLKGNREEALKKVESLDTEIATIRQKRELIKAYLKRVEKAENFRQELVEILETIERFEEYRAYLNSAMNTLSMKKDAVKTLRHIVSDMEGYTLRVDILDKHFSLSSKIDAIRKENLGLKEKLLDLTKEYQLVLKEAKVCPTCLKPTV